MAELDSKNAMCSSYDTHNIGMDMQDEPDPLFIRSRALIGAEGVERLRKLRVAVFGIGGGCGDKRENPFPAGGGAGCFFRGGKGKPFKT